MSDPVAVAEGLLREACGPRLRTREPLAPFTSFRIGGPAALYLEPAGDEDLAAAADAVAGTGIPWTVLGKGSNVLVSDRGFPGLVIRLGRSYRWASAEGTALSAGGAMPLPALANAALAASLAGFEWGVAIPGTVGGGVRMNAGAHGGSMADVVAGVDAFAFDRATRARLPAADLAFGYRRSALPEGSVVVGVELRLQPGDRAEIRARMDEARAWRRATQPLSEANCGSVFKNPPGDHAGRLVEAAGAKALSEGGATVSRKHANFIVTRPGATAGDVDRLIRRVQRMVEERFGVSLETEVHRVGEFDLASI
jgi:UDP-N-acetylmuramate dehydrogenase